MQTTQSDGGTVPPKPADASADKSSAMDWLKGRKFKPYQYPKPHREVSDTEQEAGIRTYFGANKGQG